MKQVKKAFSLIEVIFVLVILGIVASISSQIIVQVYESYIIQNALYKTSTKTELVANQIVNRLTYAIVGTTIVKEPNKTYTSSSIGTNWVMLEDIEIATHDKLIALEWIGYDNDGFSAGDSPYWSGVSNYETATSADFETPDSNLSKASTIIENLSNSNISLSGLIDKPAVLFMNSPYYDVKCMGLIENNTSCIFPVKRDGEDKLVFTSSIPKRITERYKLTWSAYALVPENLHDGLYDLFLYSNYQPWNNKKYTDGSRNLLMKNVSVFKFTENSGVIQFKLCASEDIGERNATGFPVYISSCKEKAIIR